MGELAYLRDVVTLEYDVEKCVGCGMCTAVCPHGVIAMNDRHARIVDRDACMECGACARNCPTEALSLQRKPPEGIKPTPKDFPELLSRMGWRE